jgi:hypothetical protein
MRIQLRKFDITQIKPTSVVVMIGQRNTGKSILVRDLLYHHQDLPLGVCISGSEGSNDFYKQMCPNIFIHEEYTPEIVEKFVKRQKMITKKKNKETKLYGHSRIDPRSFIVMDDCLYDKGWQNDKNIRACFLNGRHFNAFFLFTSQYALAAPPILRNNIDYVFILREPRLLARKKLHENYAGFIPSLDVWNQIVNQCTENYECLVIDNTTKSNKITDQIFWYKAAIRPDFRLCDKVFWTMNNEVETDEDEDEEELYDASALQNQKKNSPIINVSKTYA